MRARAFADQWLATGETPCYPQRSGQFGAMWSGPSRLAAMSNWRGERIAEIRGRLVANDEGALWLLFLDDPYGEPIFASAIDGAMAEMDAQLTRNVAAIINELGVKAVLLAVPRRDGRPLSVDRQLWSDLQILVDSSTELVDLLVVGRESFWSARETTPA